MPRVLTNGESIGSLEYFAFMLILLKLFMVNFDLNTALEENRNTSRKQQDFTLDFKNSSNLSLLENLFYQHFLNAYTHLVKEEVCTKVYFSVGVFFK